MANYSFTFKGDSLSHHGIEGQRWGVRNGPPYPLKDGDHSAAEKRAMGKENYKYLNKRFHKDKKPRYAIKEEDIKGNIPDNVKDLMEKNRQKITSLFPDAFGPDKLYDDYMKSKEYFERAKSDVDRIYSTYSNAKDKTYWLRLFYYDDLGQNYFDEYLDNNETLYKQSENLRLKAEDAEKKMEAIYMDIANASLGKYANKNISVPMGFGTGNIPANKLLSEALSVYAMNVFKEEFKSSAFSDSSPNHVWETDEQLEELLEKQYKD